VIIKSLGRKASAAMSGASKRGRGDPFLSLIRYMRRGEDGERAESVLWHGFYGHAGMSEADIIATFRANARHLPPRRNGNVLYHEILSFAAGYRLTGEALSRAVADIGAEYLRSRAPNQLAYGTIHFDTDHIHLHLLISANEVGKSERVRLSKAAFADIQKTTEAFAMVRHPELGQEQIYGKSRRRERLKTQAHEQAMKSRTGTLSRKEALKGRLHGLFERARSMAELTVMLEGEGVKLYRRGKSQGVMVRDADGTERRHRFSTLGLEPHFSATIERFGQREEPDMARESRGPGEGGGIVWGLAPETAGEIAASEFITGKLHEKWHGRTYSDDVLKSVKSRTKGASEPKHDQDGWVTPPRERDDDGPER
jgi:hypothetical protein